MLLSILLAFLNICSILEQVKKPREAGKGVVEEGARVEDVAGGFGSGGPEDSVGEEPKV